MAGRPVYLHIFLMPSLRLELRTLAGYSALRVTVGSSKISCQL